MSQRVFCSCKVDSTAAEESGASTQVEDYYRKDIPSVSTGIKRSVEMLTFQTGATGLGMIFYLVSQLRGIAGPLQVEDVKPENSKGKPAYCLAHNLGLGMFHRDRVDVC